MKVASGKSADQFFQKIVQQKATLYFSAILAKKGKLNLDLNLDLHGSKNLAVLMWAPVFFFVLTLYARTWLLYYTTCMLLGAKNAKIQ